MTDVEIREMIREVNLRGKLGWLNNALGGKPFSNKHRNAIQRLADHRNAFIHFKYPEFDMDDFDTVPTKLKRELESFENTIKYLQAHDRVVIKRNVRMKIKAYASREEK